ncbi:unnamed protein product, partial [Gadus morhua 'NCC']
MSVWTDGISLSTLVPDLGDNEHVWGIRRTFVWLKRGGSHAVQILQILKLQSRGSSEALPTSSRNSVQSWWKADGHYKIIHSPLKKPKMTLLLRVVVSSKNARRIQLFEVPESVNNLIEILRERLELESDFSLQFEDPEFGNALCNLTSMSELPAERAVLHIVWDSDSSVNQSSIAAVSSLDTASVHSEDFRDRSRDDIQSNLRHVAKWPIPFIIPKFKQDVELKLRKGNATYEKSNKGFDLTRDIKMEILDKIAEAIIEIKSYPEKVEIESVASSLVLKYPCLKEPGSITGYDGWKTSIKYKLGNFRSKLREAGCNEVDVNRKRK